MLEGLGIGAGIGLIGILTIVIIGHLFDYKLVKQVDAANDERNAAEELAKHLQAENVILQSNLIALKGEISTVKNENGMLRSQLDAVQKESDDLLHAIESSGQPGAIPAALRAQLDRLRKKAVVPVTAATTSAGDQGGGKEGVVHGEIEGGDPTG